MSLILQPKLNLNRLTSGVIVSQLHEGDVVYADDTKGNNHLDIGFEDVNQNNPIKHRLATFATALVLESGMRPLFIASVPSGGDGWADTVCKRLNNKKIKRIRSRKIDRQQFVNTDESLQVIEALKVKHAHPHGIVLDDATRNGKTTEAYADFLSEQGLIVDLALSLFYRGQLANLQSKYDRAIVLARHIPEFIQWDEFNETGNIFELDATKQK